MKNQIRMDEQQIADGLGDVMRRIRERRVDGEEQERDELGRFGSGGGGGGSEKKGSVERTPRHLSEKIHQMTSKLKNVTQLADINKISALHAKAAKEHEAVGNTEAAHLHRVASALATGIAIHGRDGGSVAELRSYSERALKEAGGATTKEEHEADADAHYSAHVAASKSGDEKEAERTYKLFKESAKKSGRGLKFWDEGADEGY